MNRSVLLDTGPLVAFLDRRDRHHDWATDQLAAIQPPLLTCEAVLSEACFLLRRHPAAIRAVLELIHRELVVVSFRLADERIEVGRLMRRYIDRPMSLADACLLRMSEKTPGAVVLTLDSDFTIYRLRGRSMVPTIMPPHR